MNLILDFIGGKKLTYISNVSSNENFQTEIETFQKSSVGCEMCPFSHYGQNAFLRTNTLGVKKTYAEQINVLIAELTFSKENNI